MTSFNREGTLKERRGRGMDSKPKQPGARVHVLNRYTILPLKHLLIHFHFPLPLPTRPLTSLSSHSSQLPFLPPVMMKQSDRLFDFFIKKFFFLQYNTHKEKYTRPKRTAPNELLLSNHPCNHLRNQETEHFQHSGKSGPPTQAPKTIPMSITLDQFYLVQNFISVELYSMSSSMSGLSCSVQCLWNSSLCLYIVARHFFQSMYSIPLCTYATIQHFSVYSIWVVFSLDYYK